LKTRTKHKVESLDSPTAWETDTQAIFGPELQRTEAVKRGLVSVAEVLHYIERDRLLTRRDLAQFLNLPMRTLTNLVPQIPHFRLGKRLLFRKSEVLEWLETRRVREKHFTLDEAGRIARRRLQTGKAFKARHRVVKCSGLGSRPQSCKPRPDATNSISDVTVSPGRPCNDHSNHERATKDHSSS